MSSTNRTIDSNPDFLTRFQNRTSDAFAEAECRGLMLAAKVRTIALVVILVWQIFDNPSSGPEYLLALVEISAFALLGVLQYFVAKYRIHIPVMKYVFVVIDCVLLALVIVIPGLSDDIIMPPAVALDGSRASYFYIFLMQSAFSLRPQLVLWCGLWIVAARSGLLAWYVSKPDVYTNLSLPGQSMDYLLQARPDPNFIYLGFWMTDVMVTLIVAAGLAVVVNQSRRVVESRSIAERTRANLARYFSPNVVDHLSSSANILGGVKEQQVAVLFADIIGFTKLCEHTSPENIIALLSQYHNRLGQAVFDNDGTLDKYLGDGLMATFGTPETGPDDAKNALQCSMDMMAALDEWNAERLSDGLNPIRVGIGLHYGMVVVGNIGNERRLEYSVIGDTVNIASHLEQLTRKLDTPVIVSDSLICAVTAKDASSNLNIDDSPNRHLLNNFSKGEVQPVKGRELGVRIWTLA